MKQITVKQAERWLEKLRNENLNSFKQLTKILRKYEKNDDEYDCYIRISHLFLQTPALTREINHHMEEGNKFVISEAQEEKITRMMDYIKQTRTQKFQQILELIRKMSQSNNTNNAHFSSEEQNKNLISCLKQIVKGDKQLQELTNQTFKTGEELISAQDLEHLKVNHKQPLLQDNDEEASIQPKKKIKKDPIPFKPPKQPIVAEQQKRSEIKPIPKGLNILPNMTINQEKKMIKHLEKSLDPSIFNQIVKLMHIYHLCIISRSQAIQLLDFIQSEEEFQILRDIIQSRQNDRRKSGAFRPLTDNDFSLTDRASPSYVTVPNSYPIRCKNRTEKLRKLLNDKWISVPYGSEQAFNVRNKNSFETCLLKSEDQRYQYDLYTNRLKESSSLLEQVIQLFQNDGEKNEIQNIVKKIIEMGVIQIHYKNANRQQKEEIQWHLKTNLLDTAKFFKSKIDFQLNQLKNIKQIHGLKNWTDVAIKNFPKSLDLKSFEFKKGQKDKMKGQSFINELNQRIKILQSGGENKLFSIPFQDKKSFFTILNSFQSSSKTQKCLNRKLPQVKSYQIKQYKNKSYLPVLIFAFQDEEACSDVYSLLMFYIQNSVTNEGQKSRSKIFLQDVLVRYFKWKKVERKSLSNQFDEEAFYMKISGGLTENQQKKIDIDRWIYVEKDYEIQLESNLKNDNITQSAIKFYTIESDKVNSIHYLPAKDPNSQILYATQNFYIFLRFIYALYQRIIKMKEVAQSQQKQKLFYILYFNCIKSKQSIKFQQSLNYLFGKQAYLFSTIYKLIESLAKSINATALCQTTQDSLKYSSCVKSQEIYLLLMNRYNLQNLPTNSRMIRINYYPQTRVIYLNSLYSYYKTDEPFKDYSKKRQQISKSIQLYTYETYDNPQKKKRKPIQLHEVNEIQYLFDNNSYKMVNFDENQDYFIYKGKKITDVKALKRQLKRVSKFNLKLN